MSRWDLGALGSSFWDLSIFRASLWGPLIDALRVALPLAGAMLLLYESRARRLGKYIPERLKRRVMLAFTVLAVGAYFDFFNPNVYPDFLRIPTNLSACSATS